MLYIKHDHLNYLFYNFLEKNSWWNLKRENGRCRDGGYVAFPNFIFLDESESFDFDATLICNFRLQLRNVKINQ